MQYSATYSPDDNKLRLSAVSRLDAETYARVKAAGFHWAPKQDLFFAAWSPAAEDICLELATEIGDEDTTLADRAETRAERFEGYSEKRTADAESARQAVAAIADNIPFGQPILVGHHSERHARKDAERIENGMRKAVKMWETAGYWQGRAAGAIAAAKYKERPDVRARRIKTIEADLRKVQRNKAQAEKFLKAWSAPGLTDAQALQVANYEPYSSYCFPVADYPRKPGASTYEGAIGLWSALTDGIVTTAQAAALATTRHARYLPRAQRWIDHYENRLTYERAMLAESGGTLTDKTGPEKGGAVRCWQAPRDGWAYIQKVNKVSVTVHMNYSDGGRVFRAIVPFDKVRGVMTAAEVAEARAAGRVHDTADGIGFHLTGEGPAEPRQVQAPAAEAAPFAAMKESLKAGVQVVTAPQLFVTPSDLARQVVSAAGIMAGRRILEPSAGTGALIRAVLGNATGADCCRIVAVEQSQHLAEGLRQQRDRTAYARETNFRVVCADFLEIDGPDSTAAGEPLGLFDAVVMNPPFAKQADIAHVTHALRFLKLGGRLVAIMSAGVTFREDCTAADFRQLVEDRGGTIEELPADSFKHVGTDVNTVLVTIGSQENRSTTADRLRE